MAGNLGWERQTALNKHVRAWVTMNLNKIFNLI